MVLGGITQRSDCRHGTTPGNSSSSYMAMWRGPCCCAGQEGAHPWLRRRVSACLVGRSAFHLGDRRSGRRLGRPPGRFRISSGTGHVAARPPLQRPPSIALLSLANALVPLRGWWWRWW